MGQIYTLPLVMQGRTSLILYSGRMEARGHTSASLHRSRCSTAVCVGLTEAYVRFAHRAAVPVASWVKRFKGGCGSNMAIITRKVHFLILFVLDI